VSGYWADSQGNGFLGCQSIMTKEALSFKIVLIFFIYNDYYIFVQLRYSCCTPVAALNPLLTRSQNVPGKIKEFLLLLVHECAL
jgi:hypothetical protein